MMSRSYYTYRAQLAQHAHRYPDMLLSLNNIIETGAVLTVSERDMVLNAYRNIVCDNRVALKKFENHLPESSALDDKAKSHLAKRYRQQIENDIITDCNRVIFLIDTQRFPCEDNEQMIFNHKALGDYHHYLCEITAGNYYAMCVNRCQSSYETAFNAAREHLLPANVLRLRIAMNLSIFYYHILRKTGRAIQLIGIELSRAELQMERCPEEEYAESESILDEFNYCINLWTLTNQKNGEVSVLYKKNDFNINGETDTDNESASASSSEKNSKTESELDNSSDGKSETNSSMSVGSKNLATQELATEFEALNTEDDEDDEEDDTEEGIEDESVYESMDENEEEYEVGNENDDKKEDEYLKNEENKNEEDYKKEKKIDDNLTQVDGKGKINDSEIESKKNELGSDAISEKKN